MASAEVEASSDAPFSWAVSSAGASSVEAATGSSALVGASVSVDSAGGAACAFSSLILSSVRPSELAADSSGLSDIDLGRGE